MRTPVSFIIALTLAAFAVPSLGQTAAIHLVPTPKVIQTAAGALVLEPGSRIVATTAELQPLADVLNGEILRLTGLDLRPATGAGGPGDIVLTIDRSLTADRARHWPYTVAIADRIEVTGADYNAVAMGTATLLQLLRAPGARSASPSSLRDYSAAEYPGLMLDVARQNNTLQDVRDCIDLCRLYKVRYLQLHLNDMESFMFPSQRFPKLGSAQSRGPWRAQVRTLESRRTAGHDRVRRPARRGARCRNWKPSSTPAR